nr:2Fe-2S iron-sulfur cluster-binding protein [uncultured Faecalimonas sp.]
MEKIELKINGRQKALEIEQDWSLLYIIREVLGLTGTKCGCGEGNCGTCTVIMNGKAVRSCKVKGSTLNGAEILTIEGVADGEELHPIQKAFIEAGAVQCGFCTPGMIMRAKALIDQNPDPTEQEVRQALAGHICRCGGFEKIVEAILNAAREMRGETCGE